MNNQISVQSISTDCLNSAKYLVLRDSYVTLESATPQVKQTVRSMFDDHIQMADDWFRLMSSKGWYNVPQASSSFTNQMVGQIQDFSSQTRPGQAFQY
ncbi:MAG: spore coat protein [Halanaerobiales bacterium]